MSSYIKPEDVQWLLSYIRVSLVIFVPFVAILVSSTIIYVFWRIFRGGHR